MICIYSFTYVWLVS